MSIASQITRINTNIANAYDACEFKGATMPATENSSNLARTIRSIPTGGSPSQNYAWNQMNDTVQRYLSNVVYDPSDYTTSRIGDYAYESVDYRKDSPVGIEISIPEAGTLYIYDGKGCMSYPVTVGSFTICNATPYHSSVYVVRNQNDNIVAAGVLKPTGRLRMINAGSNIGNIRDMGGWSCDGGTLKYGYIFRGRELNGSVTLSEDQIRLFVDYLGIRDEIDLREKEEIAGDDGIYGTDDDIVSSALGPQVDYALYRIGYYGARNEIQMERYRQLINRIVEDSAHMRPCYIHCVGGADRTGTICSLIEGICGVSQSDVDKDYEITSFSGDMRYRNTDSSSHIDYKTWIESIEAMPGPTFRDKAIAYALWLGVTIEDINALRQAVIDGNPPVVRSPYPEVTVTTNLTHAVLTPPSVTPRIYEPYRAELAPAQGYDSLNVVSVTMDGVDITDSCYSDGVIYISRVTGIIAVTAIGVAGYTNLVPTSTVSGGGSVYNGVGYKDGVYVSGVSDNNDAAYTSTGYIAYPVPATGLPPTIYVKGLSWDGASHTRLSLFSDSYQYLNAVSAQGTSGFKGYFVNEELGANYFRLTPVAENGSSKLYNAASSTSYLRFSLAGTGANLIVAYEPIS